MQRGLMLSLWNSKEKSTFGSKAITFRTWWNLNKWLSLQLQYFLLVRNILYSGVCFTLEHLAFLMLECSLHKFPFKFFLSSSYWWKSNGIFWTFNKYRQYNSFSVSKLDLKVVDLYNNPNHDLVTSDVQILTLATFVVYIRYDGWQNKYLYVPLTVHTHNSGVKFITRAPSYRWTSD